MKYLRTLEQFKKFNEEFHPDLDDFDMDQEADLVNSDLEDEMGELGETIPPVSVEDEEQFDEFGGDEHVIDDVIAMPDEEDLDADGVVDVVPSADADEYTAYDEWEEPGAPVDDIPLEDEEIHPDDLVYPIGDETLDGLEDEIVDDEEEFDNIPDNIQELVNMGYSAAPLMNLKLDEN